MTSGTADIYPNGDEPRKRLEALGDVITIDTPLTVRLVTPGRDEMYLRVINPNAAGLAEDVRCRVHDEDGEYWFWWSWGESIGPADDLHGTALAILRVLTGNSARPAQSSDDRPAD